MRLRLSHAVGCHLTVPLKKEEQRSWQPEERLRLGRGRAGA